MSASCPQERQDPLQSLGNDCAAAVVAFLDVQSALCLSTCSKGWHQLIAQDERLWQAWAASHLPPPLLRAAAAAAAAGQSWRAAYERATRLQSLRRVAWVGEGGQQGGSIAGRRPRPREGHAACTWGARSMLVCGGFGGGILSGGDLHLLTPAKRSSGSGAGSGAGSDGSSPGGSGSPGASGSGSNSGLRWVQPKVAGRPPVHRYGHTLTRCGNVAVLFGGLQAGGYQAPLDTLAVLRRRAATSSGGAGASGTAGAAAFDTGHDSDDSNGGSGSPSRGGREEGTSLALRQGGWQGGADGGGLHQLLWAQMFEFFQGLDDDLDDDDDDDEEEEEEEDELSDGDSQGAGSSADEDEDGPGSESSGSEYGSLEEDGSDKDWLPDNEAAAAAAARPASVMAAMARRSSSPDSPAATSGAGTAGVPVAAGLDHAAAGGLHQPVAAYPLGARSGAAAAAAAGAAAWGDEDAALAEEELEWFYPRVSGQPPGPRGYHSAAASEDGSKLFVFGGISATGGCNTLAVLDLATWEWSCPATHGTPPSPRCGHSSFVYGGRLWVVGGGSGRDLLRSGRDLGDVHCLDLATMEWRRLPLPPGPLCAGKCHASALVGRRLLLFGGGMASSNELAWLDLELQQWGAPTWVLGPPPCERMSATAVLCGEEVVVFGGYTFHHREVGDVHRLRLLPPEATLAGAAEEADGRGERAARRRQRWGPW